MKKILILFACIISNIALYAQPTITNIVVSNISCGNDGKITVTATGTGTMGYALIAPSTETRSTQASNVFEGLPAGNYTVAAYDAVGGSLNPSISPASIGGSYSNIIIGSIVGLTYPTSGKEIYCTDNGRVTVVISGGKAPYTYTLVGPKNVTLVSSDTKLDFDQLPTGSYKVSITDCNSTATSAAVTATSKGKPLNGTTFNSVTTTLSSFTPSCADITFRLNSISISINGTATLLSNYPDVRYRIVYNGATSTWRTGTNYSISMSNYNSSINQFYVEVEHPCTGVAKASPVITFSPSLAQLELKHTALMYNPCTGVLDSVRLGVGTLSGSTGTDYCNPHTVSITCNGKTYTFEDTSPWLPAGKSYTINSAVNGRGNNVTLTNSGTTMTNTIPLATLYPELRSYQTGINTDCNFNNITGAQSLGLSTTITENGSSSRNITGIFSYPTKFTYTMLAGPNFASYQPLVFNNSQAYTNPINSLWNNLQPNQTYSIKLDVLGKNGCTYSKTYSLTTVNPTYIAFNADAPKAEVIACGVFAIKGKAWVTNYGGATNTTSAYYAYLHQKGNSTPVATLSNIKSNSEVTFQGTYMVPGEYIVKYVYGSCSKEYEVLVTANSITVDYKLSGGITCSAGGTTNATIFATGGKGDLYYQIKKKGQPDASYYPALYQKSNVFSGLLSGEYIVRIQDTCGTTVANVTIQDGTQQFLTIVGSISPGVVCEGKTVILGAYSIGPVSNFTWYKNGVIIGSGATMVEYIIPNANSSVIANYKVEVVTGFGCTVSSTYEITHVSPLPQKPVLKGLNSFCAGDVTLTTFSPEPNVTFYWFKNGVEFDQTTENNIVVTTEGDYSVVSVPFGFCPSDTSNVISITYDGKLSPLAITTTGNLCKGTLTLSVDDSGFEEGSNIEYLWLKNYRGGTVEDGDLDFDEALLSTVPYINVSEAGTYALLYLFNGLCLSEISPAYIVLAKSCLTANDDHAFVFECESVLIDVLQNDLNPDGVAISPSISSQGTLGQATTEAGKIRYTTNAATCSTDGNKVDKFKYEITSDGTTYDATVKVNIVKKPEIELPDDCSDNPRLILSHQYTGASYVWEQSTDGGTTWTAIANSNSPELKTTTAAKYRVKISYAGTSTITTAKTLTITKQSSTLPGGKVFYEMVLI